jgi:hypothetical protein
LWIDFCKELDCYPSEVDFCCITALCQTYLIESARSRWYLSGEITLSETKKTKGKHLKKLLVENITFTALARNLVDDYFGLNDAYYFVVPPMSQMEDSMLYRGS